MAITSYPFDAQTTSESQFSQWAREFQDSGVADTHGGTGFVISAGAGLSVDVQPGFAMVRGHAVLNTAVVNKALPASTTVELKHRVVLRLDPTANTITIEVLAGSPGSGTPAPTRTDTGIYDVSIGVVTVPANATGVAPANIDATRDLVGGRVGVWETANRPSSPRKSRFGLNVTSGAFEYWDGTTWKNVVQPPAWSTVTGKPSTFPPDTWVLESLNDRIKDINRHNAAINDIYGHINAIYAAIADLQEAIS